MVGFNVKAGVEPRGASVDHLTLFLQDHPSLGLTELIVSGVFITLR